MSEPPSRVPLTPAVRELLQSLANQRDGSRVDVAAWRGRLIKHPKRRTIGIHLVVMIRRLWEHGFVDQADILIQLADAALGGMHALGQALEKQGVTGVESQKFLNRLKDKRRPTVEGLRLPTGTQSFAVRLRRKPTGR